STLEQRDQDRFKKAECADKNQSTFEWQIFNFASRFRNYGRPVQHDITQHKREDARVVESSVKYLERLPLPRRIVSRCRYKPQRKQQSEVQAAPRDQQQSPGSPELLRGDEGSLVFRIDG